MNPLVYLSGGITGLTYANATDWREHASYQLGLNRIDTLSPLRGKSYLKSQDPIPVFAERFNKTLSERRAIYTRDRNDVYRSDALLVNLLEATKASIGTVMEVAWADAREIPIVVAMEENNVHQHPLFNEAASVIVPTLDEAIYLIYEILRVA